MHSHGRLLLMLAALCWLAAASGVKLQQVPSRHLLADEKKTAVKPDYNLYLHKDELLAKIRRVVSNSPFMQEETFTETDGNYTASIMVVTIDAAGLETKPEPKAKLLLDFGEHGREFISSEVALRFLQVLSSDSMLSALVGEEKARRVKDFLNHSVLKVIPMENENGRAIVENGDFCYRKNGRGVDTNRNWDIDWGKKEKDYLPYEEYPGTKPFSEPEVRILLNLTKEFQPHLWLNIHSGMEALFTPYDHKASIPEGKEADIAIDILNKINVELFNKRCAVGSGGKSVGYLAHGTATDYMYVGLKVPISMTWEIYGDTNAQFHDCFKMFNPITKDAVEDTLSSWVKAIIKLMELLPMHPSTEFLVNVIGKDGTAARGDRSDSGTATANQSQPHVATSQDKDTQGSSSDSQPSADQSAETSTSTSKTVEVSDPANEVSHEASAAVRGRKEGLGDVKLNMMESNLAQSKLMQGAKSAGVWTLTVALVGLVALLATAATYGRQARKRNIISLYRPMAP